MPSTSKELELLFTRLVEGKLSAAESEQFIDWVAGDKDGAAATLILMYLGTEVPADQLSPELVGSLKARFPAILEEASRREREIPRIFRMRWLRYAAMLVVLVAVGLFFLLVNRSPRQSEPPATENTAAGPSQDIDPGREGAILTLEDGTTMVLDSLGDGVIASQQGAKVMLQNGQVVYKTNGAQVKAMALNTMSTPKGRQFRLVLQDGTQVWLNAASSIRYPIAFTGDERIVEITGEAYFEVAQDKSKPFRVKINGETEVEVRGTHFNINSYSNEPLIKATLLEGRVRVNNSGAQALLIPGQQAQVSQAQTAGGQIKVVSGVDLEKTVAWKNGLFNFEDASLDEVMRQVERWYDIEVVYEKGVPEIEFIGKMGRDLTLAEVLRGLEVSKVHFRIEGRKLVVMP